MNIWRHLFFKLVRFDVVDTIRQQNRDVLYIGSVTPCGGEMLFAPQSQCSGDVRSAWRQTLAVLRFSKQMTSCLEANTRTATFQQTNEILLLFNDKSWNSYCARTWRYEPIALNYRYVDKLEVDYSHLSPSLHLRTSAFTYRHLYTRTWLRSSLTSILQWIAFTYRHLCTCAWLRSLTAIFALALDCFH